MVVGPFMDTLRWSRLSASTRSVGSGSAPADVIRAVAASAANAAAAISGLSCRARAVSSLTVAPGGFALGAAEIGFAGANTLTAATSNNRTSSDLDMLVRGLERDLA